jgi:phosphopentomutase
MSRRAVIIVLDGVGIGEAPDAAHYGDVGSNTLGNVSRAVNGMALPNLQRAGLGNIASLNGVAATDQATVHLEKAFPTFPKGFPGAIVDEFAKRTGRNVIGNVVGSGTDVIQRFGPEHAKTGAWILYTSADSVFQIAANEDVVPLAELYRACEIAREMLVVPNDVSRVIARPFVGDEGQYTRTKNRRDYSIQPPSETLLDALESAGIPRAGVGKIDDLFAGRGIESTHTASNAEGISRIEMWLKSAPSGLLFSNLVDFDQAFGHRNDVPGFYGALRDFDGALPGLLEHLREDDLLFITADHGNDPTTPSTDHARECVPLLVQGKSVRPVDLGHRPTFSDLGATIGEWLGVGFRGRGTSFLSTLVAR